ncbi:MAG: elongation factor 1-beta [Thermoplasmatota archaeon]
MGNLVVVFRVMPEGPETDLEMLKAEIKKTTPVGAVLQGFQVKPIAFGLKALEVTVVMDDREGALSSDTVEEAYAGINGVGSVQVTDLGRF